MEINEYIDPNLDMKSKRNSQQETSTDFLSIFDVENRSEFCSTPITACWTQFQEFLEKSKMKKMKVRRKRNLGFDMSRLYLRNGSPIRVIVKQIKDEKTELKMKRKKLLLFKTELNF